ncbi:MAG: glycoside hydrolase/phage tail family protein, partial [Hyphomicrobiaceae bacterium]
MATLALAAVGAAVGGTLLPTGVSLLGATLSGAALGAQVGALAGSYVDQALFGSMGSGRRVEGPRLKELHVTSSTEGAPIPRLYGRARVGGQVIWADEIEEVSTTKAAGGSGKGLGGGVSAKATTYSYFASFAVAVCEGEISRIGRVWADGKEVDLSRFNHRIYVGSETQLPDDLIAARLGADNAPAFRGVSYILFERMALADFGNRLPQLSFEVFRDVDDFADDVRGVVVIPGSGEFVYAPATVTRGLGGGSSIAENVHTLQGGTDWAVSIDQLEAALPSARNVSLITSWFGSDLRAGVCQVQPGVDTATKYTSPLSWSVAGMARSDAYLVSEREGRAAYGGTPSDQTVAGAIQDLKARGFQVTLTPFILMDIPNGNVLSNPYDNSASQPSYPWRGRITCDPAPGRPGSPDKTAAATFQVANFVGTATPAHFSIVGENVVYSGPAEWSFRRMVLHYAHLAKAAGGVDAFVIGTELRGLSGVRSDAATFPFVDALVSLASDVKNVLGPGTKITYAADWSEYFGYQPSDGSSDVYFHLDKLWSSPAIDAIGIDLYWPLSDWRDGRGHADYLAGTRSIYDLGYLSGNVTGGEGFDFYYAAQADRDAQVRTPITDGLGKPWVFRFKDLKTWWSEQHFNRPGGIEAALPTDWIPGSKPVWLMEVGCPAVDKGSNQPNVFVDPKSSETALPYYSRGLRDDYMQRMYVKALIRAFDPSSEVYNDDANPVSAVYGERMVSLDHIHVYAWDARPYPAFPNNLEVWGDGENWSFGHWLNGRVTSVPLDAMLRQLLLDYGFVDFDVSELAGTVPGYILDHVMSARDALQSLSLAFFIDTLESGGRVRFRHRGRDVPVAMLSSDDLVEERSDHPLVTFTRGQETEMPAAAKVTYIKSSPDYRLAVAESRRLTGASGRVSQAELPIVLDDVQANGVA